MSPERLFVLMFVGMVLGIYPGSFLLDACLKWFTRVTTFDPKREQKRTEAYLTRYTAEKYGSRYETPPSQ